MADTRPSANLTGSASATSTVGPFTPKLNQPVSVALSGVWAGTVQLMRSTDGGVTLLPVTIGGAPWAIFTGNVNEPVWEESEAAATLYLSITRTSGTVNYRLAQ